MHAPYLLFAYFGPETVLPITSFVATIVGCGMMFGRFFLRHIIQLCRKVWLFPRRSVMPAAHFYRGPHTTRTEVTDQAMSTTNVFEDKSQPRTVTEDQ